MLSIKFLCQGQESKFKLMLYTSPYSIHLPLIKLFILNNKMRRPQNIWVPRVKRATFFSSSSNTASIASLHLVSTPYSTEKEEKILTLEEKASTNQKPRFRFWAISLVDAKLLLLYASTETYVFGGYKICAAIYRGLII